MGTTQGHNQDRAVRTNSGAVLQTDRLGTESHSCVTFTGVACCCASVFVKLGWITPASQHQTKQDHICRAYLVYVGQLAPFYKCDFHLHSSFSESSIFFWLRKIYLKQKVVSLSLFVAASWCLLALKWIRNFLLIQSTANSQCADPFCSPSFLSPPSIDIHCHWLFYPVLFITY